MSTIEEIVKVEREAEARLKSAQTEAETIKNNGKADAEKIIAEARSRRAGDEKAYFENIKVQINEDAEKKQKMLDAELKKSKEFFDEKAPETVKWLVDEIVRGS